MTETNTPQDSAETPQVWESLVTPGHVNAARLRRLQPWLLAAGIILMLVGYNMLVGVKPPTVTNNREVVLGEQVQKARRKAEEAFLLIPPPTVRRSELPRLLPHADLIQTHDRILRELNRTGQLPGPDKLVYQKKTSSEFWRTEWPTNRIVIAQTGELKLVGAVFNAGDIDYPMPARWLGVYRRKAGGVWEAAALVGGDFMTLPGQAAVGAGDIPVTLKPLLKTTEKGKR